MKSTHRFASFALASLLTLTVMFGIDHLATSEMHNASTLAAAAAPRA
jgi:hypothetical protein